MRDTAAGVWWKGWKRWDGCSALNLRWTCLEMNSLFVWLLKENDCQTRFATLLSGVCRHPKVSLVGSVDPLAFPENLGWLFFISDRGKWSREFHSDVLVQQHQKLLAW